MTLLAYDKGDWHTSAEIAKSININPVLVRKEIANLKTGGLIESKEGKNGGVRLGKTASAISMADIFLVAKGEGNVLSFSKNMPDPRCDIGHQINQKLEMTFSLIDNSIAMELQKQTLEEFKNQF